MNTVAQRRSKTARGHARFPIAMLGDVADIASGITLGRPLRGRQTHRVPYLRVANVKDGWLELDDVYQIDATPEEIRKCRLHYGDILMTEGGDRDKLGRGTLWQEQIPECIHQNHIFRVRLPADRFCPEYVAFLVGSPYGKAYFLAHAKQTTGIATINRRVLDNFPLLAPPLPTQRRIAAQLKTQLAEVDRARTALQAQLEAAKYLPTASLRTVFGDATLNTKTKWNWIRVRDLTETCSGTTPARGNHEFYGGSIPWVKTGELIDALITKTEEHVTEVALKRSSLRLLPEGTLLIAMYGQGQTRGRTGLLGCRATTNQACFAILPNPQFDPEFMQLWFRANYQRLRTQTEGRGGNQPNLNGELLNQELVPLPPLPVQRALAARLRSEISAAAELRTALEAKLATLDRLPSALLREVFSESPTVGSRA